MTAHRPSTPPSSAVGPEPVAYPPVDDVVTDHEDAFADAAMQAMDSGYEEFPHDE